jgi:outer membrane protein assembly factor BamB
VLATRLADELEARGAPARHRGMALWHAGAAARAYPLIREALAGESLEPAERQRLAGVAIDAGREARIAPAQLSDLLIERARFRRNRGESEAALEDLEAATPHLEGEGQVDALAFAAAILDDLQRPSDAERQVALAMLLAAEQGMAAKLGSLSTFHGRVLSRLGFEHEADDEFARGLQLVSRHGSDVQRFYASINRAWTDLDRGWMERADNGFTTARDRAAVIEDEISVADKDVYMARAKFGAGDAVAAREALVRARATAERTGAGALHFLAAIAETEGAIAFRRADDAVAASQRLDAIVAESFPGWANRAATLRARALLVAGDRSGAQAAVEAGLAATPPGANGLRLRAELDALALAAADTWNAGRAADVADRLLQAGWLGIGAWLLIERCRREKNADLGRIAAGLAHRIGNPMLAAEAIDAADAWATREAGPVALAIARVGRNVPEEWQQDWRSLPFVEHALAAIPSDEEEVTDTDLLAGLDAALASAGLAGAEAILSPSQRRAAGLVVAPSRVASFFRWVGPLVAAATMALVVAIVVIPDPPPPPTTTSTTAPATTTTTGFVTPADRLIGTSEHRGGPARTGEVPGTGAPEGFGGRYWTVSPGGEFGTEPIAYGTVLFIGSRTADAVYVIDQTTGARERREAGDEVNIAPTVANIPTAGLSSSNVLAIYASDDGVVHALNAQTAGAAAAWSRSVDTRVTAPVTVVDEKIIVTTGDGVLLALDANADGAEIWRYPSEESGLTLGPVNHSAAYADGVVYVGDADGNLHRIDVLTGEALCPPYAAGTRVPFASSPMLADGVLYMPLRSGLIPMLAAGVSPCVDDPPNREELVSNPNVALEFAPAVGGDLIYLVERQRVLALKLDPSTFVDRGDQVAWIWPEQLSEGGQVVSTPPTLANGVLYFGTEDGLVLAVDAGTGEEIWRFSLDSAVRGAIAVVDGAVYAATDDTITAIAP